MATLIRPSQNDRYYINPSTVTFVEDSGYGVQFIQVSASSSCYISVYDPNNGIRVNEESGIRKWRVNAYNNKFPDGDYEPYNIYVRLERGGTSALVVYDKKDRDVSGGVITISTDGDGNEIREVGEADPVYYYIKIGVVSGTDGVALREIIYDTGYLDTFEANKAAGEMLAAMFVPHYENPDNPTELTWIEAKSHMGIRGGVTAFVDNGTIDLPSLYAGIPVDETTITKREDGALMLNPNLELGGLDEEALQKYLDGNNYAKLSDIPSLDGYAKLTDVDSRISDLVNGAPQAYDTLKEIADVLQGNVNSIGDIITTLGTKWTQDDSKIANWDSAYGWGNHANAGYFLASNFTNANIKSKLGISDWALEDTKPSYTTKEVTEDTNLYFTNQRAINALTETLKAYVTLKGTQIIEGEKDFVGGLKVNGSPIVYDSENRYWKLQGNLLITGGLTQYVDDGSVDLPNIYDGLPIDGTTIYWAESANGKVLKAKVADGGLTEITDTMIVAALGYIPYSSTNPNGYITSAALNGYATQTWVNQQGYLTEHQDLSGYQTKITSTNKLAYSLISGTPDLSVYLTTSSASSTYQPKITSSAKLAASLVSGLATVATSGSYNDLSNKPTIPTNTNQLTNGAGFITASDNVASATKLQTARTIWGQSFDGTGDVTGTLTDVYSINMQGALIIWNQDKTKDLTINWLDGIAQMYSYEGQYNDILIGASGVSAAVGYKGLYYDASEHKWGIGITTPEQTLDVNGTFRATDNVYLCKDSNYRVGIRTETPEQALDVNGGFQVSGMSRLIGVVYKYNTDKSYRLTFAYNISSDANTAHIYNIANDGSVLGDLRIGNTAGNALVVSANNRVGIGKPVPEYKLDVNGSVGATQYYVNGIKVSKTQDGVLCIDGNLVVTGGITTYYDNGTLDLPNIYDGLPIDGTTIYWEETSNGKVLKAKVADGGLTEITDTMIVEALGYIPYSSTNPNGYITSSALNGYATQSWVNQQGFLTEHQDLSGYQTKITSTNKLAYSLISGTPDLSGYLKKGENATSATKLQTARTIWGQSFDGTANINGKLTYKTNTLSRSAFNHSGDQLIISDCLEETFLRGTAVKFQNSVGTNAMILTGGNLGIGTTSPKGKLHVEGNSYLRGTIYVTNPDATTVNEASGKIKFNSINDNDYYRSPYIQALYYGTYARKRLGFFQSNELQYDNADGFFEALTILPNGNIGVNQPSPEYKLHVNGTGYFQDSVVFGSTLTGNHWGINDNENNPQIRLTRDFKNWYVQVSGESLALGTSFNPCRIDEEGNFDTPSSVTINGIKLYKSNDGVLFLDGNLVVRGGITQYADDGTTAPSIFDSLPVASTSVKGVAQFSSIYFSVSNGIVTINEGSVGLNEDELNGILEGKGYLTSDDLIWSNIKSKPTTIAGYGITDAVTLTGTQYISGAKYFQRDAASVLYIENTGETNTSMYTAIRFRHSGAYVSGIASSNTTDSYLYRINAAYSTIYKIWDAGNFDPSNYLLASSYTAADVLAKLKTVDGKDSGLDADLLDGKHLSDILASNVASATKLATSRKIWGQSFDGQKDVKGNLYICSDTATTVNEASGKIKFNSISNDDTYRSPYIQAINENTYSRKRLGIFQSNAANYTDDFVEVLSIKPNGNIGINQTSPEYKLDISGSLRATGNVYLCKDSNYRVGIRTETPEQALDVNGGFQVSGMSRLIGTVYKYNTDESYRLTFAYNVSSDASTAHIYNIANDGSVLGDLRIGNTAGNALVVSANNRVGIGKSVPEYKLDVSGTTRITGAVTLGSTLTGNYWYLNNSSTNPYLRLTRSSVNWYVQLVAAGLALGAGSANSCTIDASGNFLSVGGITQYSDIRKKTKLNDVELTLKQVANAPLIEHYYNSDDKKTTHVGSIAQYWAEMNDWFCKLDGDGYYTMEIQNAALASAISVARELERYESKTDKTIRMLKKRINELEDEIEKLKSV